MQVFRARYVFPIDSPPIRDGVVAIDGDRIVAVGSTTSPTIHDLLPMARDLGNVAILPGLINAHTHLEFSDLLRPLGYAGIEFPVWIREVIAHRRQNASLLEFCRLGFLKSMRLGVTTIGEIASSPWNLDKPLCEIIEFCEVIAFKESKHYARFDSAVAAVLNSESTDPSPIKWSDELRPGISPHAPYTVRPEILKRCIQLSTERNIPLAMHLAESREEMMLLRTGSGPFVALLKELDAWDANVIPFGTRPFNYLQMLAEAHRALIIHGNYLDDEEIEFLAQRRENMSVVYCPRTHAYFQHDPYPLAKMYSAGVNVALGTDSLASNPDLSILKELQFAAQYHPLVSAEKLLRMITINAAKALGRDAEIGTITVGKFADLAVLKLPEHDATNPHELLLDPQCAAIATIFRGRAVFGEELLSASP
jgi:cytosine/adenosine deaminase-related metal-dependent hydrolase